MTSNAAALELVQVTKIYGNVTAVDAINLKIPAGSYCCLLGPSGCGKTSTLRMIAGHESATSGDIIVGPKNVTDLPPAERNTAMMFQSYALFPHLSVIDNVAFALKMRGVAKADVRRIACRHMRRSRPGQLAGQHPLAVLEERIIRPRDIDAVAGKDHEPTAIAHEVFQRAQLARSISSAGTMISRGTGSPRRWRSTARAAMAAMLKALKSALASRVPVEDHR